MGKTSMRAEQVSDNFDFTTSAEPTVSGTSKKDVFWVLQYVLKAVKWFRAHVSDTSVHLSAEQKERIRTCWTAQYGTQMGGNVAGSNLNSYTPNPDRGNRYFLKGSFQNAPANMMQTEVKELWAFGANQFCFTQMLFCHPQKKAWIRHYWKNGAVANHWSAWEEIGGGEKVPQRQEVFVPDNTRDVTSYLDPSVNTVFIVNLKTYPAGADGFYEYYFCRNASDINKFKENVKYDFIVRPYGDAMSDTVTLNKFQFVVGHSMEYKKDSENSYSVECFSVIRIGGKLLMTSQQVNFGASF